MEINKEIHTAVTVANRFATLHNSAKNCRNAIGRLRFDCFSDSLTDEESKILKQAEDIAAMVENKTSQQDAEKYLKTLTIN